MRKCFLLFVIFVSFFYFSQNAGADYCEQICMTQNSNSACYATDDQGYLKSSTRAWTCSINEQTVSGVSYLGYTPTTSCDDSSHLCYKNSCPSVVANHNDGDPCTVRVSCGTPFLILAPGDCHTKSLNGVWDKSQGRCVVCTPSDAALRRGELFLLGQGTNPYVYVFDGTTYNLQNPGDACLSGTTTGWQSGDAKFESACGADVECDEKTEGSSCIKGGQTGTCQSGICTPPLPCSAILSVPTSPQTAPCTVSASVSATGCDGQTFAIKDSAGTTKCSGIITAGSGTQPCSSWSISSSASYSLYLSGSAIPSDTKTVSCG